MLTFHVIDYLHTNPKPHRDRHRVESAEFAMIDRVAHAFKHVKSKFEPLESKDVISRPPAYWDVAQRDLSRCDDHVGGVTLVGERDIDMLGTIWLALTFLRSKIAEQVQREAPPQKEEPHRGAGLQRYLVELL